MTQQLIDVKLSIVAELTTKGDRMTDTNLLMEFIVESGMTKKTLAERAGFSRERLYTILEGSECRASEIEGLARALKLTNANRDRIFFAKEVAK